MAPEIVCYCVHRLKNILPKSHLILPTIVAKVFWKWKFLESFLIILILLFPFPPSLISFLFPLGDEWRQPAWKYLLLTINSYLLVTINFMRPPWIAKSMHSRKVHAPKKGAWMEWMEWWLLVIVYNLWKLQLLWLDTWTCCNSNDHWSWWWWWWWCSRAFGPAPKTANTTYQPFR